MFTRIIDPFNNQTWKVANKPVPTFLYKTKSENLQQIQKNKTVAGNNKRLHSDDTKASDTWTVGASGPQALWGGGETQVGKEKDCDYEIDDFVMV